jgi:hypothetical protein
MSQKTVMAVFDDRRDAKLAVEALHDQGFTHREVSLLSHAGEGDEGLRPYQPEEELHSGSSGAATGGMLGGLAGLLIGLGMLTVPGVGPVVAAGPIASTLVGAGMGAVMGSLMGVLLDYGVPENDAHLYSEAVRRGGTIVAITAPPERVDAVSQTLHGFNAIDLSARAEQWRGQGWTGFDEQAGPYPREAGQAEQPAPFPSGAPSLS